MKSPHKYYLSIEQFIGVHKMAFWGADHSEKSTINDPKRKFRFIVQIEGLDDGDGTVIWYAKSATKPSFKINAAEHKYLNHTFYFPGNVTWGDVSIDFVDPQSPDASRLFAQLIEDSGYRVPANSNQLSTISKATLGSRLGSVTVKQLNASGAEIEAWTLWNPVVINVEWGQLSYGEDALVDLKMDFKYDWATLASGTTSDDSDSVGETVNIFSPGTA